MLFYWKDHSYPRWERILFNKRKCALLMLRKAARNKDTDLKILFSFYSSHLKLMDWSLVSAWRCHTLKWPQTTKTSCGTGNRVRHQTCCDNRCGLEHSSDSTNYLLSPTEVVGSHPVPETQGNQLLMGDIKYIPPPRGLAHKMGICFFFFICGVEINWLGGQNGGLKQDFFSNNLWP